MPSNSLADHWQSLDEAARVDWLKRLLDADVCLSAEQLNIEPQDLDPLAQQAGLVGVRKTVVDAAGMRDWEHGVVGPSFINKRVARPLRVNSISV